MTAVLNKPPCELCHFCLKADPIKGTSPGGHCIWFDARLRAEDLGDKGASVRLKCIQEGDHFMWRSAGADAVGLVTWRKGVFDQRSFRYYRNLTTIISVMALIVSFIAIAIQVLL